MKDDDDDDKIAAKIVISFVKTFTFNNLRSLDMNSTAKQSILA